MTHKRLKLPIFVKTTACQIISINLHFLVIHATGETSIYQKIFVGKSTLGHELLCLGEIYFLSPMALFRVSGPVITNTPPSIRRFSILLIISSRVSFRINSSFEAKKKLIIIYPRRLINTSLSFSPIIFRGVGKAKCPSISI